MDLDWCIVCDRHTSGGIYCSQACRNKDTPQELQGKAPVVPGPLDQKKLAFPLGMTGNKRTTGYYGYNNSNTYSSNDDDSSDSDEYFSHTNNNNAYYFPSKVTQNDKQQQPKKELLVSYGALTANTKPASNQASQNFKFLPRQSHMNFQEQTARIF